MIDSFSESTGKVDKTFPTRKRIGGSAFEKLYHLILSKMPKLRKGWFKGWLTKDDNDDSGLPDITSPSGLTNPIVAARNRLLHQLPTNTAADLNNYNYEANKALGHGASWPVYWQWWRSIGGLSISDAFYHWLSYVSPYYPLAVPSILIIQNIDMIMPVSAADKKYLLDTISSANGIGHSANTVANINAFSSLSSLSLGGTGVSVSSISSSSLFGPLFQGGSSQSSSSSVPVPLMYQDNFYEWCLTFKLKYPN